MWNWIRGWFRPSVDNILSSFTKSLSKLEAATEHHESEANAKTAQANLLKAQVAGHRLEADRALNVANKIKDLIT